LAAMTSSHDEVEKIFADLKDISLKIQQLEDKKKILCVFQELRNRAEFGETEEAAASQEEINDIDNNLNRLTLKKAELQKKCDNILNVKDKKSKNDIKDSSNQDPYVNVSDDKVFFVEPPPAYPVLVLKTDVSDDLRYMVHTCNSEI
ncbi:hypothetical protein ILYODFUR_011602, partial [Ilyodon furcidens]